MSLREYPGYNVREPEVDDEGFVHLNSGDELVRPYQSIRHGMMYDMFQISSVRSYAIKNGDDPTEAVEMATRAGHDLHYIFGLGVTISNMKAITKKEYILVEHGTKIKFEGLKFVIEKAPNRNLSLKQI